MTTADGLGSPKKLEWKRFYLCAVVAEELAVPARDWLWQRHQPKPGRRMQMTHCTITEGAEDGIAEMHLLMEYAARGANGTDVKRKVWEALTVVGGSEQVLARVESKILASVWLDFSEYAHKDPDWLADKVFAAQALADEINERFDPDILDPEDDPAVVLSDAQ